MTRRCLLILFDTQLAKISTKIFHLLGNYYYILTYSICKIYNLGKKYYEIDIRDGYSHNELPQILNETNLGIIPVLWEDNLPQVAIEIVAHGVPILASDLGGAHELCNDSNFIFKNNNINDFSEKLEFLFSNRNVLDQYWKNRRQDRKSVV